MRLGIKAKLVTTLVLAGLLPLMGSLVFVTLTVVRIRTDSVGQSFRALARQKANQLSTLLSSQIEFAWTLSHLPGTAELLAERNAVPLPPQEQIEAMEQRWSSLSPKDEPLRTILENPVALRWQSVRTQQPRFAEVMLTDALGRLVAATNKTTDYYQADEQWWNECYAAGKGKIFLSDVGWDESAISFEGRPGALVANLCIPIYGHDRKSSGDIAGILKISFDAGWLVQHLEQGAGPGYADADVWLVGSDGHPVTSQDEKFGSLPEVLVHRMQLQTVGWFKDTQLPSHELMGFAQVSLPRGNVSSSVEWYVVVAANRFSALGPLYRVAGLIIVAGLLIIALSFVVGLYVAQREIIHPLLVLGHGVAEIGRGNVQYRLPSPSGATLGKPFRPDEIGQLAEEFNRMAEQLRLNLERLRSADRLKEQFIDLASHELRTPITYLLAAAQLAQRQCPQAGPIFDRILARSGRLNHIVDNMFKLLQSGIFDSMLHVSPIDVEELVDGVVNELQPFLDERQQQWDLNIEPGLPKLEGDAAKIHDILVNLLSNAIRFSPDRQKIGLTARPADGGNAVEFIVTDRGAGISPEDLPHIFQPFHSGRRNVMLHTSGEFEHMSRGIGLGLSVVKRFVDLHGGTVDVNSSSDGTRFTIRLPRTPAPPPAPEER